MEKADITITKEGTDIARASIMSPCLLGPSDKWPGIDAIKCYYFQRMTLFPPIVWQVLGGASLGRFFDGSSLLVQRGEDKLDEAHGLRYVHGRAEVAKGRPTISTVLLVQVEAKESLPADQWIGYLPEIYKSFLQQYGVEKKTA